MREFIKKLFRKITKIAVEILKRDTKCTALFMAYFRKAFPRPVEWLRDRNYRAHGYERKFVVVDGQSREMITTKTQDGQVREVTPEEEIVARIQAAPETMLVGARAGVIAGAGVAAVGLLPSAPLILFSIAVGAVIGAVHETEFGRKNILKPVDDCLDKEIVRTKAWRY